MVEVNSFAMSSYDTVIKEVEQLSKTLEDYAAANLQDPQYDLDKKNVLEMKEVTITFPQRAWTSLSMLPPPGLLTKRSRSAEEGDNRNDLDLYPFRLTANDVSAHELGDEIHGNSGLPQEGQG
nr:hypothetical protein Iba_chr05cCG12090 [Ipomoea batatas]